MLTQTRRPSLKVNLTSGCARFLVFTSAGDYSNLQHWKKGFKNFDLWISYYGNQPNRYAQECEYYHAKKGGKFPALHFALENWMDILGNYEAIMVMDDDIIISASSISRLFDIRSKYDLWLLQPAFDLRGKISHPITKVRPNLMMRYTNFVEVTCPVFRADKLQEFMKIYDPCLVGWGIDWWFLDFFSENLEGHAAIVDSVSCVNPRDSRKGGVREIENLQDTATRRGNWQAIKTARNIQIDEKKYINFDAVKMEYSLGNILRMMKLYVIQALYVAYKMGRKLLRMARGENSKKPR